LINVYLDSSFSDYYDQYLKSELPLYIFHREPSVVNQVTFEPVSRIDTKTSFIEIDNQWKLVKTDTAKLMYPNKKAFPNEDYTYSVKNVYINNKCYTIKLADENITCEVSEIDSPKDHIIEVYTLVGNSNNQKLIKTETNVNLQHLHLDRFIGAEQIANEIEKAIASKY
jgi:hypothetical protein